MSKFSSNMIVISTSIWVQFILFCFAVLLYTAPSSMTSFVVKWQNSDSNSYPLLCEFFFSCEMLSSSPSVHEHLCLTSLDFLFHCCLGMCQKQQLGTSYHYEPLQAVKHVDLWKRASAKLGKWTNEITNFYMSKTLHPGFTHFPWFWALLLLIMCNNIAKNLGNKRHKKEMHTALRWAYTRDELTKHFAIMWSCAIQYPTWPTPSVLIS